MTAKIDVLRDRLHQIRQARWRSSGDTWKKEFEGMVILNDAIAKEWGFRLREYLEKHRW